MGIVDLGVDVAVAGEFGHEHLDAARDGHLPVEDRENVVDGGNGLGGRIVAEGGDAGDEAVHGDSGGAR